MRILLVTFTLAVLASPALLPAAAESITEAELVRRTRALFDAVAIGDKAPWDKYFADDCLYFDEKGRSMDKKALLADLEPLPTGYSGTIALVRSKSRITGDMAILSYDLDETEIVFGQKMTARYHDTDTWIRREGEWRIIASQALRYYEDPPTGTPAPEKFSDYTGTYALAGSKRVVTVVADSGKLYLVRDKAPREELIIESGDIFFRHGVEGRAVFRRNATGHVDAYISRRNNEDIVWERAEASK